MGQADVIELGRQGIQVALLVAGPLLMISLVIGLVISLFQVATSIQDVTLTFVPKIVAVAVALLLIGPWMLRTLIDFTRQLFNAVPGLLG